MGKKRYELDIERYGADVLDSEELQHAFQQTHHTWSTVGEHTLRVAAASLIICYALRKIHVRTDISAVVKGALCHDLGILGRDEKYSSRKECSRQHPTDFSGRSFISFLATETESAGCCLLHSFRELYFSSRPRIPRS